MTLLERVAVALADDGQLASALEGFEIRHGQRELAAQVASTFEQGGTLLAEAGTGTGKTLAYLLPAILSGRRVLISTGTRTLQDQIFYKDLPSLARALDLTVSAAYMKGRTNYLCLHRFDRLHEAEAGLPESDRRWMQHIAEWAAATTTGDRAEIDGLPDDLGLWSELTATTEQCLGRECSQYEACFITKMKERAAAADLVIVNHHLLCADASVRQGGFGEVIPDTELAVVDEAHQLEDVVTMYFGVNVGTHRVDELMHDASRAAGLAFADDNDLGMKVATAVSDAQHECRRLFDAVRAEVRAQSQGGDRLTLSPGALESLHDAGAPAIDGLERIASAVKTAREAPPDLVTIAARAVALADELKIVLRAGDPSYVHFAEVRGRGVTLRAAPIDVSAIVRRSIVGDRRATVLTSATLAVEGRFDYVRGRLGLSDASTVRLPSEFDFRSQAILFLPAEMPDPRSPEFNRAAAWMIGELVDRTRGRAFALFTSHQAMRDVHAMLERRIGWPMLVQGTAPRSALLRDFRNTPNAVLLATASFWQGVDVAGEQLSCVIIDRLPFASPADPLVAARIRAITERGGHPFHEYQVPLATLTLLQGLGRLIRTRADRGVLAVLDPRLQRMSYGRRFLGSLPPAPVTEDLAVVERFFSEQRTVV